MQLEMLFALPLKKINKIKIKTFCTIFALAKNVKKAWRPANLSPLEGQCFIHSDFGNQFLPFGSPARKRLDASAEWQASEGCVLPSWWMEVPQESSSHHEPIKAIIKIHFLHNSPKDESPGAMLQKGSWSHQTYLPSSHLTDAEPSSIITVRFNLSPLIPTNRNQQESVNKSEDLVVVKVLPEISLLWTRPFWTEDSAKQMQRSFPVTGKKIETVFENVISTHFYNPGLQWRKTGFSRVALNKNIRGSSA